MTQRITENDLLLPALYVIYQNGKANTSTIKNKLIEAFNPSGEDNEIFAGRNDTKFSQKVRNLMGSHYDTNGMKDDTSKDKKGFFTLTNAGQNLIDNNIEYLTYLFNNGFKYEKTKELATKIYKSQGKKHKLYLYDENDMVFEGKAARKSAVAKERSKKLRDAAIQHYTVNGKIRCAVCGFDFYETYGEHGENYIQIHHENPIYQYSDEGFSSYLKEAIKDTKPVCANCHCMIHRKRNHMLTIDELKDIIKKTSRP